MIPESSFSFFGTPHILALLVVAGMCFAVWPFARYVALNHSARQVGVLLAGCLVIYELTKLVLYIGVFGMPWLYHLPLHLCDVNILLCAFMLARRSYRSYEVSYFWAMGGSVAAMLTPDLAYGFPHPVFFAFFLGHGLAVAGVLYATFGYGFRPRLQSIAIAMSVTVLYGALIMPLNFVLGTNYLYLRAKPVMPSVLDYLGPWPWYVVGLVGVCVVVCFVSYAPFALVNKIRGQASARKNQ